MLPEPLPGVYKKDEYLYSTRLFMFFIGLLPTPMTKYCLIIFKKLFYSRGVIGSIISTH